MKILVLNSGSSSLKYKLFDGDNAISKGHVDGIGLDTCKFISVVNGKEIEQEIKVKDHVYAVQAAIDSIRTMCPIEEIKAIGHRVVHGGEKYKNAVKINEDVIKTIDVLSELAPLHNPPNLQGIKACQRILPHIPQVAVFDTAFHQTIPKQAFLYGVPMKWYKKYGVRKYGFHGTSHKYVMEQAKKVLKKRRVNLITCHLGNGASIAAIKNNKSVDTTMGFTPLQGLIMGTRSGDIDPAIIAFIAQKEKIEADDVVHILNKESGLLGVDGYSDVRTIHEKAVKGDKKCQLGLMMYAYRIVEYVGAYFAVLGKVDAIVFTAGVGVGAYYLRDMIAKQLTGLGVKIDIFDNKQSKTIVSTPDSKVKMLVIPTNEELMIAKETRKVLKIK